MHEHRFSEKRRFTRVRLEVDALVKYDSRTVSAQTKNISLKGICLSALQEEQIPERVRLDLHVQGTDSSEVIELTGRVVRQDKDELAIEFGPMEYDTFMHLKTLICLVGGNENRIVSEFVDYVVNGNENQDGPTLSGKQSESTIKTGAQGPR